MNQEMKSESIHSCTAEADIKQMLTKMRNIKLKKETICGDIMIQIENLQEALDDLSRPFDHESNVLENQIKELMTSVQHTLQTEYGKVNYRKGSFRVSYNAKALDSIGDERVQRIIRQYRKETPVQASVSIEVF
ncbi:MAG: hypothetical protein O8C58_01075 [Candidatus Methanoperedens sp.]|nr:hypothetical protein [Candidatus Methanoperedens sp.]